MAQEFENNVVPLSQATQNRKREMNLGELDEASFRKILGEVVDASVSSNISHLGLEISHVSSNISHLESKISRLEVSMNRIADQFEAIRNGEIEDAALRVTTDLDNTDIALANIKMHPEEYYKYTCSEIAKKLNIQKYDVIAMTKKFGLRENPKFNRKISSGIKSSISKWSEETYLILKEAIDSKKYIPKIKKVS